MKDRSQIARGARRKGRNAQNDIAKVLGLWFFNDSKSMHSTPSSGGLRWSLNVAGTRGDIVVSENLDWPFSIEIKNQEKNKWDLLSLLSNAGPILEWWDQCKRDAEEANKEPWLIFTRNNIPYISIIKSSSIGKGNPYLSMPPRFHFTYYAARSRDLFFISNLADLLYSNKGLSKFKPEDHNEVLNKLMNKVIFNRLKEKD